MPPPGRSASNTRHPEDYRMCFKPEQTQQTTESSVDDHSPKQQDEDVDVDVKTNNPFDYTQATNKFANGIAGSNMHPHTVTPLTYTKEEDEDIPGWCITDRQVNYIDVSNDPIEEVFAESVRPNFQESEDEKNKASVAAEFSMMADNIDDTDEHDTEHSEDLAKPLVDDEEQIPQVTWMDHLINESHFHRLIIQTRLEHEFSEKLQPTVAIVAHAVADKLRITKEYTEHQLQALIDAITSVLSSAAHDAPFSTPSSFQPDETHTSTSATDTQSTTRHSPDVQSSTPDNLPQTCENTDCGISEFGQSMTEHTSVSTTRSVSSSSVSSDCEDETVGEPVARFPRDFMSASLSRSAYGLPLDTNTTTVTSTSTPSTPQTQGSVFPPLPTSSSQIAWAAEHRNGRTQNHDSDNASVHTPENVDEIVRDESGVSDEQIAVDLQERFRREASEAYVSQIQFDNDMRRFGLEMETLFGMDFLDAAENIRLLRECDGDVSIVVNRLLG
eukprot:CFRG4144T1